MRLGTLGRSGEEEEGFIQDRPLRGLQAVMPLSKSPVSSGFPVVRFTAQEHPSPSSYPSFVKVNFQGSIFLCLFLNLRI